MAQNWVFGYGSLMWRPGFQFVEARQARIHGYHRSLCVYSWVHRGRPDDPGLVLGLDHGGSCRGMAFRVADEHWAETVDYLRAREQATNVYLERQVPARLDDGSGISEALCFVVDRSHPQYAGVLDPDHQAEIVRHAAGQSGPNTDYVLNTIAHMEESAISDPRLSKVARLLAGK